jgi:hypothetical protein
MSTDAVVAEIEALLARAGIPPGGRLTEANTRLMSRAQTMELTTSFAAAIERLARPKSAYAVTANRTLTIYRPGVDRALVDVASALCALRDDFAAGYLRTIEELVHADVFADFLEMGGELLAKGYKDPAAVVAGSVLEEHLRKLATRNQITVEIRGKPKKAETLNADLTRAEVYNKLEQKNVTAWLGLRNDAAHGHYDRYDKEQVESLIDNVRAFLGRHPA